MKKFRKIQALQFRNRVLYPVSNIIDISNLQYEVIILQKKKKKWLQGTSARYTWCLIYFHESDFSNTCYAWKSTSLQYDCNCTANSKIGSESSLSEVTSMIWRNKVRTFWEARIIWKKSSSRFWHLLSKSADLSKPRRRFF